MIQNSPARGGEKDHSRTLKIHEIRHGDDSMEISHHHLQVFRIATTGDPPAAHWQVPERSPEIPMDAPKEEVDLEVETRMLVQLAKLG